MSVIGQYHGTGVLWRHLDAIRRTVQWKGESASAPKHGLAFAGLYLFMLVLYARPNDLFPSLGALPLARTIAVLTLVVYALSKLTEAESVTIWPLELKMIAAIILLGIGFAPFALSPQDSIDTLTTEFLRIAVVFVLMINLITTLERLRRILKLSVLCGGMIGLAALRSYLAGDLTLMGQRVEGVVGGMFGNPNELALSLLLLAPLAVALGLTCKGIARVFYFGLSVILTAAVIATFSRGGFLGLTAVVVVGLWKIGRRRRFAAVIIAFVIASGLLLAVETKYGTRLSTIVSVDQDPTGSAQRRQELLTRAIEIAVKRPIVGVGMGNFHIYSIHDQVAHNAYLETSAELGLAGLIAYLVLIFAPLWSLRSMENQTYRSSLPEAARFHYLSVALQAGLVAYAVCSFFMSDQYQWHLYILVAYSVAVRNMYVAWLLDGDRREPSVAAAETVQHTTWGFQEGILWKQCRGMIGRGK